MCNSRSGGGDAESFSCDRGDSKIGILVVVRFPQRYRPKPGLFANVGHPQKRIWAIGHREFAWQSRYHDQIIRDVAALDHIRYYI